MCLSFLRTRIDTCLALPAGDLRFVRVTFHTLFVSSSGRCFLRGRCSHDGWYPWSYAWLGGSGGWNVDGQTRRLADLRCVGLSSMTKSRTIRAIGKSLCILFPVRVQPVFCRVRENNSANKYFGASPNTGETALRTTQQRWTRGPTSFGRPDETPGPSPYGASANGGARRTRGAGVTARKACTGGAWPESPLRKRCVSRNCAPNGHAGSGTVAHISGRRRKADKRCERHSRQVLQKRRVSVKCAAYGRGVF